MNYLSRCNSERISRAHGVTLLEVLVSIVVLALGLLGILGVQLRTLADTQTAVRRTQAIRLIEDLNERIVANPSALTVLDSYVVGWGTTALPAACPAAGCTSPATFAADQMRTWKQSVAANLPGGDATTFLVADETNSTRRQLGVMLSWRRNEDSRLTTNDLSAITTPSEGVSNAGAVPCDPNNTGAATNTCHLQFISLNARCYPDLLATPPPPGAGAAPLPPPLLCQ